MPVRTNPKLRESRLFPSMWTYVRRNGVSIFRIYAMYEPLRVFMTGALLLGVRRGASSGAASSTSTSSGEGAGHVQSLILGAVLFNAAMVLAALGVLGDLLCGQRITLPAHLRARAPRRAGARRAALALRAGRHRRATRPTTGARAGQPGKTEEREAIRT